MRRIPDYGAREEGEKRKQSTEEWWYSPRALLALSGGNYPGTGQDSNGRHFFDTELPEGRPVVGGRSQPEVDSGSFEVGLRTAGESEKRPRPISNYSPPICPLLYLDPV